MSFGSQRVSPFFTGVVQLVRGLSQPEKRLCCVANTESMHLQDLAGHESVGYSLGLMERSHSGIEPTANHWYPAVAAYSDAVSYRAVAPRLYHRVVPAETAGNVLMSEYEVMGPSQ